MNGFEILANIKNIAEECRDANKKLLKQDVGQKVLYEIENRFTNDVEYFDQDVNDKDIILGTEDPKKITEIADGWNAQLFESFKNSLEKLYDRMKTLDEKGVSWRKGNKELYDLIVHFKTSDDYKERSAFSSLMFDFVNSIKDLDERISPYTTERFVADFYDYGYNYSVYLSKDMLKDIHENPSDYAVVTLLYK